MYVNPRIQAEFTALHDSRSAPNSFFPSLAVWYGILQCIGTKNSLRLHLSIGLDLSRVCWAGPLISVHTGTWYSTVQVPVLIK